MPNTMNKSTLAVRTTLDKILEMCGYVHTASYQIEPEPARQLGESFYDYMVATIYDSDWEGYTPSEVEGIQALFEDWARYVDAAKN